MTKQQQQQKQEQELPFYLAGPLNEGRGGVVENVTKQQQQQEEQELLLYLAGPPQEGGIGLIYLASSPMKPLALP